MMNQLVDKHVFFWKIPLNSFFSGVKRRVFWLLTVLGFFFFTHTQMEGVKLMVISTQYYLYYLSMKKIFSLGFNHDIWGSLCLLILIYFNYFDIVDSLCFWLQVLFQSITSLLEKAKVIQQMEMQPLSLSLYVVVLLACLFQLFCCTCHAGWSHHHD